MTSRIHPTCLSREAMRLAAGLALLVLASAPRVRAQAAKNEAAAELLFQEGRSLYEAGRYAEACPKLAESQRIDPATGTLLALALCHEGEQKLASAWAEFTTVQGEARRAGRTDRETIAREHAAAIRPRLSMLTINVPPEVRSLPGLELKLDGTVIGAGTFGVAVPVDGGSHEVRVLATGKKPWQASVSVKNQADAVAFSVPALEDTPAPVAAPTGQPQPPTPEKAKSASSMPIVGMVVAGAGVLAFGAGGYLALTAKSDYDRVKNRCPPQGCSNEEWEAGEAARRKGNLATVVFGVGGALVVTGGVLWLTAPKPSRERQAGVHLERVELGPSSILVKGAF
jgi:hypothetical protein